MTVQSTQQPSRHASGCSAFQAATGRSLVVEIGRPGGIRTVLPCIFPPFRMDTNKKRKAAPPAPATAEQPSQDVKRKPAAVIRVDDCSASIWAREVMVQGQPRTFYSITLERSYKDRDGAWKYTKSFDADSLGKIVSLTQQAEEKIRGLSEQAAQ